VVSLSLSLSLSHTHTHTHAHTHHFQTNTKHTHGDLHVLNGRTQNSRAGNDSSALHRFSSSLRSAVPGVGQRMLDFQLAEIPHHPVPWGSWVTSGVTLLIYKWVSLPKFLHWVENRLAHLFKLLIHSPSTQNCVVKAKHSSAHL
jgi:hypothetical protein